MARIELRYCTIRIKDGLAGTALCNQPVTPPVITDTSLTINTVSLNTDVTTKVPVGARFTIAGETASDTVHTVTARTPTDAGPTTAITFSPALTAGTYTNAVAGVAGAVTTPTPGDDDPATDEIQSIARHVNNVTGGTYTLTFTLEGGGGPYTTSAIAHNANAATIQTAVDTALAAYESTAMVTYTAGDVAITGGPLHTTALTITFSGASVEELAQSPTTIDGALLTAAVGTKTITFIPQAIVIKVGEGDLKYTETRNFKYDLDRGLLDTVRFGDDVPMDISSSFTYEHITQGTSEPLSPVDAIKRRAGTPAEEWVSSATDKCEPFAVDIEITFTPPCGTSEPEVTTFPDFRSEKIEPDFKNSLITLSGKCHATEPIVSRTATL